MRYEMDVQRPIVETGFRGEQVERPRGEP